MKINHSLDGFIPVPVGSVELCVALASSVLPPSGGKNINYSFNGLIPVSVMSVELGFAALVSSVLPPSADSEGSEHESLLVWDTSYQFQ